MTWCAASLSLLLAATPPAPQRFNTEPVVLAVAGALGIGFSAWRFERAEFVFGLLQGIPKSATSQAEAVMRLAEAQRLAFRGKSETALAGTLAVMGSVLLIVGIVWFLVEGRETTDWLAVRF